MGGGETSGSQRARRHHAASRTMSHGVPHRLLASWQRSEAYGVPLEEITPVFAGTVEDDSLFFQAGQEALDGLQRTLVDEPVSLMLTDPDGLVLTRGSGDHGLLRALDRVHLAPGFSYAEREAGTNGLGLALADRLPTLVRAEEHYALSLAGYTCAAAPVLDPRTGRLLGAVNLTTWADTPPHLMLALVQAAAGSTASLVLARGAGHDSRPMPRGEVRRLGAHRLEPGAGAVEPARLSTSWRDAFDLAVLAQRCGRVVAAVGEPGAGRTTLLAQALRARRPHGRILAASAPAPQDAEGWLGLWSPELGKPHTVVVLRDADALPAWAAEQVRDLVQRARRTARPVDTGGADGTTGTDATDGAAGAPIAFTCERFEDLPAALRDVVDSVVPVPPLRERPEDAVAIAEQIALRVRGREVGLTPAARRALADHGWPGNTSELVAAITHAATRADVIDVVHLPPSVLAARRRLTRLETFERDEIVRVIARPGITMRAASDELGISRATLYRRVAQYDIRVPR
ncbi:helix-turn-helix domain-containing protein [Nocardioides fonticola]